MAFTKARAASATRLGVGDRLFLYTTRSCFRNPTRDRGRVIGIAEVQTPLRRRRERVVIADREFTHDCGIEIQALAPLREGVVLADFVDELDPFPDARTWSFQLRKPLLPLSAADGRLIEDALTPLLQPPGQVMASYR
jgi:hypothetical protein